jgi:hypothetical protein
VGDDRAGVLLAVPGAFAAQAPGDLIEVLERFEVRRRCDQPPGVSPGMPLGAAAGAAVPSPAGWGPCGELALARANGLKDPGAPGVGPVPVHWSWLLLLLAPWVAEPSWQVAKTGAGHPPLGWPGWEGASLAGSQVGPPPLKLSQPWTA